MLNIIKRYGKTGTAWITLSRMFADRGEEELNHQIAELIETRLAYEFDGIIYPGPAPKRMEKPKVACPRTRKAASFGVGIETSE